MFEVKIRNRRRIIECCLIEVVRDDVELITNLASEQNVRWGGGGHGPTFAFFGHLKIVFGLIRQFS